MANDDVVVFWINSHNKRFVLNLWMYIMAQWMIEGGHNQWNSEFIMRQTAIKTCNSFGVYVSRPPWTVLQGIAAFIN